MAEAPLVVGRFVFATLLLSAAAWGAPLRFATFNVEWGLGSPGEADFENTATVLHRIGADVVALQELIADSGNLQTLGDRLSLPHVAYQSSSSMSVGLLSKYPLSPPVWISRSGMTRPILLVRADMPGVLRDPWIAVVHLKCCNDYGTEQYTRAVELYYLRKEIDQRTGTNDPVLIMGDFNLVAPNNVTYATGPEGVGPFPAPASADGYFVPQGIFKLDARHAGSGWETWTWRSNGQFPNGALDHIMVNAAVRARGTAVEIYNAEKDAAGITGLSKQGALLPAWFAYTSDHLPVFADVNLDDGTDPPHLTVDSSAALNTEGPINGPFTSAAGSYILRNNGSQPLEWAAEHDAAWLSLSANSGTLAAGASVTITASVNDNAASLPFGLHRSPLRLINRTNGMGTAFSSASVFVGSFRMDGVSDAPGYTVSGAGITLRVAVRGTKLYVATRVPPHASGAEDHHLLITDALLPGATAPAPWSKRGLIAADTTNPYLAAEGENAWSGWFNGPAGARLHRAASGNGVLEGSIDLVEQFGTLPEFIYIAAVAYDTRNAAASDPSAGRVVGQVPLAVVLDDDITPDEFLKIPLRSITDSAGDGRFDLLVPGRGFAAQIVPGSAGQASELRWPALPWRNYTVLRKSDLASSVWEPVHSVKAGAHTWELSMPDSYGAERGFYKVEVFEPGF
jgi:endonuclease/exonuclease/phosphatase family metal-dependent hydrolase